MDSDASDPVSLDDAFAAVDEHWAPRLVAELNGQAVKVARVEGEFVWHDHADADELFLVRSGTLAIEFRERADVRLEPGDLFVVPRGVEHRPVADGEAEILLFEPSGTTNTGDVDHELTRETVERIE